MQFTNGNSKTAFLMHDINQYNTIHWTGLLCRRIKRVIIVRDGYISKHFDWNNFFLWYYNVAFAVTRL